MTEEWRPVVGWEGLYEVSDLGRVRSLDRVVQTRNRWGIIERRFKGRVLSDNTSGAYLTVALCKNGQARTHLIHTLVAEAFIGRRPQSQEVCHGPKGQRDNSVGNLRYGTHSENLKDRDKDGTTPRGESHPNAKMTANKVKTIRESSDTQRVLAKRFGISQAQISTIVRCENWSHV